MANSTNRVKLANYLLGQQSSTLGKNYVKNSMALQNTANVTASGATVTRNTSSPLTAISDFSISLQNNATDTVTWALDTLDNSMSGKNCELRLDYTASSIGSNVVFQVLQGSSVVAQTAALTTASTARLVSLNVPCGDLGSATTIVLANGTGNSGTSSLKVANVSYGLATNLTSGSFTTGTSTTAYSFTPNSGAFGTIVNPKYSTRRVGDKLQFEIQFTNGTPSTGTASLALPTGLTINSSAYGTALQTVVGTVNLVAGTNSVWASGIGAVIFYDGSDTSNLYIGYRASSSTAIEKTTGSGMSSSGHSWMIRGEISISQFTDQPIFKPETTPASWSGYHSGISGGCSVTSTTWADVSSCTGITLNQTTNRNFGTVTTAGSSLPGITFTPPRAGMYHVCAIPQLNFGASNIVAGARLVDGSGTVINAGHTVQVSTINYGNQPLCGIYNATSAASTTFKIQLASSSSSVNISNSSAPTGASQISWSIAQLDTPLAAPYLVGSVISNSSGVERMERALIANNGTCTITSQSGSWISSVSNTATGKCTLTFAANMWSAKPVCVCSQDDPSNDNGACNVESASTSSAVTYTHINASTANNNNLQIICMGLK